MLIAAWKDASLGGRGDVATSSVPVMSVAGCGRCQQNRTENRKKDTPEDLQTKGKLAVGIKMPPQSQSLWTHSSRAILQQLKAPG